MDRINIHFEDVNEGDEAPEWKLENVNRTHFVRYAGASGDFNPMHHDETLATKAGFPSVFGHGMFTAGVLSHYVTDWVGVGNLRTYRVRFSKQLWPGDTLTFKGKVTRKYKENGENRIDTELSVTNHKGEPIISGSATAALPSRG
jgi:acyl dehydratase